MRWGRLVARRIAGHRGKAVDNHSLLRPGLALVAIQGRADHNQAVCSGKYRTLQFTMEAVR